MTTNIVRNDLAVLPRVVGNRESIGFALQDMEGEPENVTGRTIVFRMVDMSDGSVKVNNAAATLDTAASGLVSYTPAAVDVDTAGRYACFFLDTTEVPNKRWPYDGARFQLHIKSEVTV